MKDVKTKMKKEVITRKEFDDDFATIYQYQISYANDLISKLELFEKVVNNTAAWEDNICWFAIFYVKNIKNNMREIPTVTDEDIQNDYKLYRDFVASELRRLKPLAEMHYYSMLSGVNELKRVIDRINSCKLD